MMISKQEPISILERIRLTYRGFQVFGKANPGLNLSVFLVSLVKGVSPYVTIYFCPSHQRAFYRRFLP